MRQVEDMVAAKEIVLQLQTIGNVEEKVLGPLSKCLIKIVLDAECDAQTAVADMALSSQAALISYCCAYVHTIYTQLLYQ